MTEKNSLLFVMNSMNTGGAEKSLINLLKNFNFNKYIVTLLLVNCSGDLLGEVSSKVNIISLYKNNAGIVRRLLGFIYRKLGWHLIERLYVRWKVRGNYHAIISYMEGAPLKYHSYVTDRAIKNLTWVHTDLKLHGCDERIFTFDHQLSAYKAMSDIVFVSKTVRDKFAILFNFNGSFHVLYNIVEMEGYSASIEKKRNNILTVISVGRLVEVKAFDRIVRVAALAKDNSYKVKFVIVGDGPLRNDLERLVKNLNVGDYVQFVGAVSPPYDLMINADIILITSIVEGFPLVVMEAFALNKPVIATRFSAASEVLNDGEFGMLSNHDDHSIFEAVHYFLSNPKELDVYGEKASLGHKHFSKHSTVGQLMQIIDREV